MAKAILSEEFEVVENTNKKARGPLLLLLPLVVPLLIIKNLFTVVIIDRRVKLSNMNDFMIL